MKKKSCIIFSNGQGIGLQYFLKKSPSFQNLYDVTFLYNYKSNWKQKEFPINLMKQSDILIYQKTYDNNLYLPLEMVRHNTRKSSQLISFPNIYFAGLWPFFEEGGKIVGKEEIIDFINKGYAYKDIIRKFCSLTFHFDFEKRFSQSKEILATKDLDTDIKISDFILGNIYNRKLFLTQNHPTSIVFTYLVNQILSLLKFPSISCDCNNINEANLPGYWPISPYDLNYYNFSYQQKADENWKFFYSFLIAKIYYGIGINDRPLQRFFVKEYTKFITQN